MNRMMNPQDLEGELYGAEEVGFSTAFFLRDMKDRYDDFRIKMKAYGKVVIPRYKRRLIAAKNKAVFTYPCTSFFVAASSILTPLAALIDPRPQTFAVSLGMVVYGYVMDKLAGAPFKYRQNNDK